MDVNHAASISGIDVVQMFDLDLSRNGPMPDVRQLLTIKHNSKAFLRCRESFSWLLESQTVPRGPDELGLSVDIPKHYLKQIRSLFDYIVDGQQMYSFIGLLYHSSKLAEVMQEDGVALGRLLSGGLDHESDETMREYVSEGLSHRRYEGLFLQSGGGLGVYTSGTEENPEKDLELYERTLFRAVQICELCLIEQRLLTTFRRKVDQDAKKVQFFPRPFLVERHREQLLELENQMVKTLPFRTPEAEPLVRKAQEIFQIPTYLRDSKDSYDFLEKRYQNTKATALAALAVATYILDKLKFWDKLASLWHHS